MVKEKIQQIVNNETPPADTIEKLHQLFLSQQISLLRSLLRNKWWDKEYGDVLETQFIKKAVTRIRKIKNGNK